jgi:CRISPR-associated endonuclease/helicase Cas3
MNQGPAPHAAPPVLLAKSMVGDVPPRGATLTGHTAEVLAAANVLLTQRGLASLRAAGLPAERFSRLRAIVRMGAFIHDLGKASAHFQESVRGTRSVPQLIRHEVVSLLAVTSEPLRGWLEPTLTVPSDLLIAATAALGHHRKYPGRAFAPDDSGAGTRLPCFFGHPDFATTLRLGGDALGLGPPPPVTDIEFTVGLGRSVKRALGEFEETLTDLLAAEPDARPLLAIAKVLLLDADVAGSALPRTGEDADWITDALANRPTNQDIEELVARRLEGKTLRPFQNAVAASSSPVTLVRAGCGTGKTVAAYLWGGRQHPGRQLWITYPTTGTATEGFRDYVAKADLDARLESSRAEVDIEMLDLRGDDDEGQRSLDRLDAIRMWQMDAIVATTDTVLGLMQNQRKGMYAWAGLCDAAVVFDEIHAYDDRLFGTLLRFLTCLPGIPALLMTASLPAARLRALQECVQKRHGQPLAQLDGPPEIEALPRYRLVPPQDPMPLVRNTLDQGGKVLWVSNTVGQCMRVADELAGTSSEPILIYHSRFRYEDRVARHRDVVNAFRAPGAVVACTTQVAEMSLDLSADLLVTDLAPVPALIQRLGRLNRRSTPENTAPAKNFVVLPATDRPYDPAELAEARTWLSTLANRDLSQTDLAAAWAPVASNVEHTASAWWDDDAATEPRNVREGSPGITVVLNSDREKVQVDARQGIRCALPMPPPPRALRWQDWPRVRFCPVPPSGVITYSPSRGAAWLK